jgi:uncharacterized membrane protein
MEAALAPSFNPPRGRMTIAMLALLGLLVSVYLTLYKVGLVGSLQCSVGGCSVVQASEYAVLLGVPVALWGVGAYGVLLGLALAGIQPTRAGDRKIAWGIFLIAAGGFLFAVYLTYLEAFVIHAWCQWCVISAILITGILIFSIPPLRRPR